MGVFFLTMKKTPSFWLPTSAMRHQNRKFLPFVVPNNVKNSYLCTQNE